MEFVARFGVVPREVVAMWAETGRAVTAARERRLREAGLVEVLAGVGDTGKLVLCTRAGLRAVSRTELPAPHFSPGTVQHTAITARVAAKLELEGRQVLSEREIFAHERAEGKRVFSVPLTDRRFHRPDLVVLGDLLEAIEVELTVKATHRLDLILRAWRRGVAGNQFGGVCYVCGPRALSAMKRSIERTRTSPAISLIELSF